VQITFELTEAHDSCIESTSTEKLRNSTDLITESLKGISMNRFFQAILSLFILVPPHFKAVAQTGDQDARSKVCWDALAQKEKEYEAINRKPLPDGATPSLMRVMWMTADSMKVIDAQCAGDAKAAQYRSQLQTSFNQAKTACEQLSTGTCSANPFDGSAVQDPQAAARLAEQRQAAAQQAAQRRAAEQAERERQAELKQQQEMQNLTNALGNLMQTLQNRKQQAAPANDGGRWR
jgi:hypothetical protein